MRVAFLHYHLRPGGVTTVIRDQVVALQDQAERIVLTGESPSDGLDPALISAVHVVPGIGYSDSRQSAPESRAVAEAIRRAMLDAWGAPADLLHVHNPTLNKNPALPGILRRLQEGGTRLLVQVHDLAEDGRPSVFFAPEEDYPRDCHYGVINSRDRAALVSAGLRPQGVHLMWNLVRPPGASGTWAAEQVRHERPRGNPPRLIYPVRGIRRKNIGEAILLAEILPCLLTITLPPRNEADLARYRSWKDFARALGLPIRFDAGLDQSLGDLLEEADGSVSTSLNEGFGFALLEPWAAGIPVGGRRIRHVCADFEKAGVSFPSLYDALPVPLAMFNASSFSTRWRDAVSAAFRAFGRALDGSAIGGAWSKMSDGGVVDFGSLDEEAQRQVITRIHSDRGARQAMDSRALETLRRGFGDNPDPHLIAGNRAVIMDFFGMDRYARLLGEIYRAVCNVPLSHHIDRRMLLDSFLDPARFRMLEQR